MQRASAPDLDRFKSIVTLILVLILILMLLRGCAATPSAPVPVMTEPPTLVPTTVPPTESSEPTTIPLTDTPAPPPAAVTDTPAPVTDTPAPPPAPVTDTPAQVTDTPAPPPEPAGPTPTATPSDPSCNTRAPSRLSVGGKANVLKRLNMRQEPSIQAGILQVNPTGTLVEIIGGPVCQPVQVSAYLWWQIRTAGGLEGWSAESPLNQDSYFLEPVP